MEQRIPRRHWSGAQLAGRRPRLLVEDDQPALAISDFSLFKDAGFEVAFCSGPGDDARGCPLMHGEPCALLTGADVVLHGLDPALGIAAAIRRQYPRLPVVVEQDGDVAAVPAGCIPLSYPCSVRGQIDALLRATARLCSCQRAARGSAHALPTGDHRRGIRRDRHGDRAQAGWYRRFRDARARWRPRRDLA